MNKQETFKMGFIDFSDQRYKELEAKILEFSNILRESTKGGFDSRTSENVEASYWLTKFIKHFDIKIDNKGI